MSTIYEIGMYLLFLWIVLWISLADSNSLAKKMSQATKRVFEAKKFESIQRYVQTINGIFINDFSIHLGL